MISTCFDLQISSGSEALVLNAIFTEVLTAMIELEDMHLSS